MSRYVRELEVALDAAAMAGRVLLEGWGTRPDIRFKTNAIDLLTEYDGRSEAVVVERLRGAFPADAIIAEEGGGGEGTSGRAWFIDPLDGTTNFSHGLPLFSVSIGLCEGDTPVLGVVTAPALQWTFQGGRGVPALWNGQPVHPSPATDLQRALLVTGFPYVKGTGYTNLPEFAALMESTQGVRRLGSASLDCCFVACGWLDGYWERLLKPWDLVAGVAIVEAAGGRASAPDGSRFVPSSGDVVATNGHLHDAIVAALAAAGP